jgi:hypothetical protein
LKFGVLGFEQGHAALGQKEHGAEEGLDEVAKPQSQHQGNAGADVLGGGVQYCKASD